MGGRVVRQSVSELVGAVSPASSVYPGMRRMMAYLSMPVFIYYGVLLYVSSRASCKGFFPS